MQNPMAQRIGMPGARSNPIAPQPPNPMGPPQGQPPTQTTPNLYRPGGPINQPPIPIGGQNGPSVLNTVQGQNPQVRRPMFGQYPNIR